MTKISTFIPDKDVSGKDKLIGTDANNAKKTKNFDVDDLGRYFNVSNGVASLDYTFYNHISVSQAPANGGFYSSENEQDPNNITHFFISKLTENNEDNSPFFDSISTINPFDLVISQKTDVNKVFYFNITDIESINGYYKLIVSKIFSHGINVLEHKGSNLVFYLESNGITIHNNLQGLNDGDYIHLNQLEKDKFDGIQENATNYTDEKAQDAVGSILSDSLTIDFTYNNGTPEIKAEVKPNAIGANELANNINISEFNNDENFTNETYVDNGDSNTLLSANAYSDSLVTTIFRPTGSWDASGNTFPTTGTGISGAIRIGDTYNVTVAGTPVGFETLDIGDNFYAKVNNATQNASDWAKFESNTQQATESFRGTAKIATQAIIENESTTNDTDIVTAKKFWQGWTKGLTLTAFFNAVKGTVLTGLSLAYTRITSSDSILTAFGKTQGQIDDLLSTSVSSFSHNINSGDNTKFDFTVSGVIRNPSSGVVTTVINHVFTAQSVTHNANGVTFFGVKEDMTLTQQSTRFTTEQKYNHLCEWAVIYNPSTFVIITFNDYPNTSEQIAQQVHNFMKNSGVRNLGNNQYTNFGTTILNLYKPVGGIVEGVGWGNLDQDNPNEKNMPAILVADTFSVRKSTGDHLTGQTVIDPTIYEDPLSLGSVITVPNPNDVTVYRITFFNSNLTRVQMGQTLYANIDEAIARTVAKTDSYTTETNIADNGLTVTYLAIQKNCTAWSQTTRYRFFPAPQSGNASSATFVTFNSIYQSIVSPHLNITDTKGAFDFKSDMASNSTKMIRGFDNANNETWWIKPDGTSSFGGVPDIILNHQSIGNIAVSTSEQVASMGSQGFLNVNENVTKSGALLTGPYYMQAQRILKNDNFKSLSFRYMPDGASGNFIMRLYAFKQNDNSTSIFDCRQIFDQTFTTGSAYFMQKKDFIASDFIDTATIDGEYLAMTLQQSGASGVQIRCADLTITY